MIEPRPRITDHEWCQEKRSQYPECAGDDDDTIREKYADGCKYHVVWDNLGDAYEDYEVLANAYCALKESKGGAK